MIPNTNYSFKCIYWFLILILFFIKSSINTYFSIPDGCCKDCSPKCKLCTGSTVPDCNEW